MTYSRLRHVGTQTRHLVTSSLIGPRSSREMTEIVGVGGQRRESSRADFLAAFPVLVEDVIATIEHPDAESVVLRFKEVCEYNVPHGKLNRGRLVVDSYEAFADSPMSGVRPAERESLRNKATILGWCVEWLQASLLVLDDVMDSSPLRRGRPAWHARTDVGIVAVNDGLFLENCVFVLLEKHFNNLRSFAPLNSLFRMILFKTIFGQSLDMNSSWKSIVTKTNEGVKDGDVLKRCDSFFKSFTRQRYEAICVNKTALYTFTLPVLAGMRLAEISDFSLEARLSSLLQRFGLLFQCQDDFLDCFGDVDITGKTGTDIEEGKCTWLLVEALLRADDETKVTLAQCYGRDDPHAVATIKDIYRRLGLPSVFHGFEIAMRNELENEIKILKSCEFSVDFLTSLLNKMEKRQK